VLYNGIKTKEILTLINKYLKLHVKHKPTKKDLRTAIGLMKSAPDYEEFARRLLEAEGYEVQANKVIQGHCVKHEIDGVAAKNGELCYVETKHHSKTHIYTPFIVTLAAKAKFDDIKQGYIEGRNEFNFDKIIIICNTRLSSHANQYAKCMGIDHIGWKTPYEDGVESIISRHDLYPVTILNSLTKKEHQYLSESGIITLNDLFVKEIKPKTSKTRIIELQEEAEKIINSC
jgi:Holliday junction resolvase-like predicted endonuclease